MAFEFNVASTPKSTSTTAITFNAYDTTTGANSSTLEVKLTGTGLAWNDTTDHLTATTVTTLTYATSGTAIQTTTLDTATAATLVADMNTFVDDSRIGIGTNSGVTVNKFGALTNYVETNNTGTYGGAATVDIAVFNGATQTGIYRLVGSSIGRYLQPSAATVSYIEIWNTAGTTKLGQIDPAVVGDTWRFDALKYGWGLDYQGLSNYLMHGNDTISVAATNTGVVDGGMGNDNITHLGTGLTDTISYMSAEGAVTVTLADPVSGVTSGTSTDSNNTNNDTLTGFEYIIGSRYEADHLIGNNQANRLDGGTDDSSQNLDLTYNGVDFLDGGLGNDTYVLRDGHDIVTDSGGTDTIQTTITRSLMTYQSAHIETLELLGTGSFNLTGDGLANTLLGNIGNNVLDGGAGADTMNGGSGNDTYIVDNASDVIVEATSGGTDVVKTDTNYVLTSTAEVETLQASTASGTATISLTGSNTANTIIGNQGANTLQGSATEDSVTDILRGGGGNDTYVLGAGSDTVDEATALGTGLVTGGVDTITSTIGRNLASYTGIENLTLLGTSSVVAYGNSLNNKLVGNSGDNTLWGAGGGNDTYTGNGGADVFWWDASGTDSVTDFNSSETDKVNVTSLNIGDFATIQTLMSAVGSTASKLTEYNNGVAVSLSFTGKAASSWVSSDFTLASSTGNETITGNANKMDYKFGADGADTMYGGTDTTLNTSGQVIGVTDYLFGETGNDTLDGKQGGDFMYGGTGDDTYYVDSGSDHVIEKSGEGTHDKIITSLTSFTLNALTNVEDLQTSNTSTTTTVILTGNASANILTGHAGSDILDGKGGADTMNGGDGSDTYYVDNAGDQITGEAAGLGDTDTVRTVLTYTLGAGDDIEVLQAWTGLTSGGATVTSTTAMDLTGNTLDQKLIGNTGINHLDGKTGNDTLTGGGGNDYFDFTTTAGALNKDTITDFNSLYDTIRIENAVFTALGSVTGTLASNKFYLGTAAHDLDDRIIYNRATGELHYDSNGSAAGGDVVFAVLSNKATVAVSDIVVI